MPPILEFVDPPRPLAITSGEQMCARAIRAWSRHHNQQQNEDIQGNDNMECVNDSESHNLVVLKHDRGKGKKWHRIQKRDDGRESNLTQWIKDRCRPQLHGCLIRGLGHGEQVKTHTVTIKEI